MQRKILEKPKHLYVWFGIVLGIVFLAVPMAAYAYSFTMPPDVMSVCESKPGFTQRIIVCIRDAVLHSANAILGPLFGYFYGAMTAAITFAVALWGFRSLSGKANILVREGGTLLVKIGALLIVFGSGAFGFTTLFGTILDIMGELLGIVSNYFEISPSYGATCGSGDGDPSMIVWARIDCALDIMIGGILPGSTIKTGITAFFLAALVTNAAGFFVGALGFLIIIQILFAMARAVYVFVLSYLAFAMVALVAPLFIPMILFRFTRGYFEKWLKLSMGFALQPIFITVYLVMMLAAFDTIIYTGENSLFNVISNNQFQPAETPSCKIGEFLLGSGCGGQNVYDQDEKGSLFINYDAAHATGSTSTSNNGGGTSVPGPTLGSVETGASNVMGEITTTSAQWKRIGSLAEPSIKNIYQTFGSGGGVDPYFFQTYIPTQKVKWNTLAGVNGEMGSNGDPTPFLINLFLALAMALATSYIFMQLIDALPFIGSGITADSASVSSFGFGGMAPPGESLINGLKRKVGIG